ncbi:MAG: hypothetical protein DRP63_02710 [Planctomycetota bacterium]|nr:MAG: hypothetical protein DRP63_02710 [Planctomycetota bacterium]
MIELNGPAARLGEVGDLVHILAYVILDQKELPSFKTRFVYLDDRNAVVRVETEEWC